MIEEARGKKVKNDVAKKDGAEKDGVAKKTSTSFSCVSLNLDYRVFFLEDKDGYGKILVIIFRFLLISFNSVAKPKKAPVHPSSAKMVTEALTALKNRRGVTMPAIYKYLAKKYDCKTDKGLRRRIHNHMEIEFVAGNLVMVNDDSETIKFNGRYKLVN